jgi:hypothetical protein
MVLSSMNKWSGSSKIRVKGKDFKAALERELSCHKQDQIPPKVKDALLSMVDGLVQEEKTKTDYSFDKENHKGIFWKLHLYMRRFKYDEEEFIDFALMAYGANFTITDVRGTERRMVDGFATEVPVLPLLTADDMLQCLDMLGDVAAKETMNSYSPQEQGAALKEAQEQEELQKWMAERRLKCQQVDNEIKDKLDKQNVWIRKEGLPENEGAAVSMSKYGTKALEDIQQACEKQLDCVGFAFCPAKQSWFPKKKDTGFVPGTARYTQKWKGENWQWYYLANRAESSLGR